MIIIGVTMEVMYFAWKATRNEHSRTKQLSTNKNSRAIDM